MSTTLLIIIVVGVVLLGIMSVLVDVHKRSLQQKTISEYTAAVATLREKLEKKEDLTNEATYIIAKAHEMSSIFHDALHPTITLSSRLANNGLYGIDKYINEISQDEIQALQRLNDEKQSLLKQLLNPFTLFYRGIGFILRYVFGYLIELFNKDFDFEGKVWKTFNFIITLLASIFTMMTFFGYDWSGLMQR